MILVFTPVLYNIFKLHKRWNKPFWITIVYNNQTGNPVTISFFSFSGCGKTPDQAPSSLICHQFRFLSNSRVFWKWTSGTEKRRTCTLPSFPYFFTSGSENNLCMYLWKKYQPLNTETVVVHFTLCPTCYNCSTSPLKIWGLMRPKARHLHRKRSVKCACLSQGGHVLSCNIPILNIVNYWVMGTQNAHKISTYFRGFQQEKLFTMLVWFWQEKLGCSAVFSVCHLSL